MTPAESVPPTMKKKKNSKANCIEHLPPGRHVKAAVFVKGRADFDGFSERD